jgi:hypothetical protein
MTTRTQLLLTEKNETTLLVELKDLVSHERETTTDILHYLREIERRKIHLERGYPSLFEFTLKELGYSSGSAFRRISAMRLMKSLPEVEDKIKSGVLSLSVAAQAYGFFREEGKHRIISKEEKKVTVESLSGLSTRECERKLLALSPTSALPKEKERVISEEFTQIQFVADRELLEKLERLKGLLAHRNFEGGYTRLFHQLADLALKKLDPTQNSSKQNSLTQITPTPNESERQIRESEKTSSGTGRHIPIGVKRIVFERDDGRCKYRDKKTGRVCDSQHAIEYDHITPLCMGGDSSAANLRLLCSAHHRMESLKLSMLV